MLPCNAFLQSELFERVQLKRLFKDSKTFADAVAKESFEFTLESYNQKPPSNNELAAFVESHFLVSTPAEVRSSVSGDKTENLNAFIDLTWKTLTKMPEDTLQTSSLLQLPHSYLIPGGRFQEIYYWDSYFSALGLIKGGNLTLVKNMLDNFVDLQSRYGIIPNGNRAYYLSRSQPPILALLVNLLQAHDAHFKSVDYLQALLTEYEFWTSGETNPRAITTDSGFIVSRFYDNASTPRPESFAEDVELSANLPPDKRPNFYRNLRAACESGWDFSSRWLTNQHDLTSINTTNILPIDLNALLAISEQTIINLARENDFQGLYQTLQKRQRQRQRFFDQYFWRSHEAGYFDLHKNDLSPTGVASLACVMPLYAGLASPEQANHVANTLKKSFLKPGGLLTTLHTTGQQWDSPNGWAPLHWFAVEGLKRYGHKSLANEISSNWLNNISEYFTDHGVLMEKYNVMNVCESARGGEYENQLGFGWTNGVFIALQSS